MNNYWKLTTPLLFLAALVPWTYAQLNISLPPDHAWLTVAASRLMDGGTMTGDAYETNPPLSILLYFPVVALSRVSGIPLYYCPALMGMIAFACSAFLLWRLMNLWPELEEGKKAALLAAYVAACALLPSNFYFAERDEYIIWGLFPFAAAQLLITKGVRLPRWISICALPPAALCILLKPDYLIFPIVLFIHRAYVRRNIFSPVKDADFISLAAVVAAYACVIVLFFRDYLTVILPEFLHFYLGGGMQIKNQTIALLFLWPIFLIVAALLPPLPQRDFRLILMCGLGGVICLGLYYLQMNGFTYQLIPALVFLFCGSAFFIYSTCCAYLGDRWIIRTPIIFLTLLAGYLIIPLRTGFPTHEQYMNLAVPRLVSACGPHCPFFFYMANMMEIEWSTSIYLGQPSATRFPSFWGVNYMYAHGEIKSLKARYSHLIAEDLRRYKPKILIIQSKEVMDGDKYYFKNFRNFMKYFSDSAEMRTELGHYRKTGELKDNLRYYFKGTNLDRDLPIFFDIYSRLPD